METNKLIDIIFIYDESNVILSGGASHEGVKAFAEHLVENFEDSQEEALFLSSVSNRRKLLISTIEKVRYNLDGFGALTSSQIAERLEKAINCL